MKRHLVVCFLIVIGLTIPAVAERPPGIMFSTLLNNVKLLSKNGSFRLDNKLQAVFVEPGTKGWVILKKEGGEDLVKFEFEMERMKKPFTRFDFRTITDLQKGETIYDYRLTQPGNYVLDFFLEPGNKFYTFPFSVVKVSPEDPFAEGERYFFNGAWNDWGYLYYYNADPSQSISWKVWLRHVDTSTLHKDVKIRIEVRRGKKLVCTSREGMRHSLSYEWNRYQFDLIAPMKKTSGGRYFKAKDLLAMDGSYQLVMTIDGKRYGTWKFKVKDHKLQYTGRTVRGKADPLTFVEGGRDAWWYEKQ